MLKEAVSDPELKGKVKLVFKHFHFRFHKDAKACFQSSHGRWRARQVLEMADKLLANQRNRKYKRAQEMGERNPASAYRTGSKADLKNNDAKYDAQIKNDMEMGTRDAKVRGTPSIFVGGWQLQQRSVDGIKSLLKDKKLL